MGNGLVIGRWVKVTPRELQKQGKIKGKKNGDVIGSGHRWVKGVVVAGEKDLIFKGGNGRGWETSKED